MRLQIRDKLSIRKYLQALLCFSAFAGVVPLSATVFVTSTADSGGGSLRNAILQVNDGGVANSIQFTVSGTITLASSLPLIGPNITSINSNSQIVTINGGNLYQAFALQPTANTTIGGAGSFTVMNAASIGGNGGAGSNGGGGALGAGGGIFIASGANATIQGVSFNGCFAHGGTGGVSAGLAGFGGGGGSGMSQGTGGTGSASAPFTGGGGGGGYGGAGGAGLLGGGGGGGMLFPGGDASVSPFTNLGGGGGGSDANPGLPGSGSDTGGNGGNDFAGNTGGSGGTTGTAGTNGTGNNGAGGGGGNGAGNAGAGGNSVLGAGGGGASVTDNGGTGGSSTGFGGGGGAGGGPGPTGGNGGRGGNFGGGGGGSIITGSATPGGNGGFGGGGGGTGGSGSALTTAMVGNGGFGAGGGGGYSSGTSGKGGFAGGNGGGAALSAGGGGGALGGTIFVGASGTLTIQDPFQASITSAASAPGLGANPGIARGVDIFLMSSGSIVFNFSNPATTFTINTAIESDNGAAGGGITMNGTGILALGGNNNYTGSTTLNAGIIQISNDNNLGAAANSVVFNGGTLDMTAAVSSARLINLLGIGTIQTDVGLSTWSGAIIGSGPLQKTGPATLLLSNAANTYSGGTNFNAGIVQISSPGNIGTGALNFGGGTLELLAAFASGTLTNAITVNASGGTIQSDVAAIQNPVFSGNMGGVGGILTINQTAASTLTFSGNITGANGFQKNGPGTLILSGSNSNSGNTTISSGTLQINSDSGLSSQSNVLNNAALVFNNSGAGTYAGSISGTGSLTMQGSGSMDLAGNNTYSGNTTVQSGTLFVDGTITTSPITVNVGGTLGGTGQVQNVVVNGTLAPGDNNVGTLHGANFTFNAGSTLNIDFNNTASSQVAATNTVTINPGAFLTITPVNFTSPQVTHYTLITASSVITNAQFTIVNPLQRFGFEILYAPTEVLLLVEVAPFSLFTHGNAKHAAVCFDAVAAENPPDLVELIKLLDVQTTSQLQHSFNQMQPANFDNIAYAEENVAERIRQIFTRHFYEQKVIACPEQKPFRVWLVPFAETVRQHGKEELPGYKERFAGVTAAGDYRLKKHWMFSGGFSYAAAELTVPHGRAKADFSTYAGSLGAVWTNSKWFADGILSYLYSPINARRKMDFSVNNPALTAEDKRKATHHDSSNQGLAHLGGGYDYTVHAGSKSKVKLYPFFNVDYLFSYQAGYTEKGAQSLNLKVEGKPYDLLRPEAGAGISYQGCFKHIDVMGDISASYVLEYRYTGKRTHAHFEPASCRFTVEGLNPENNVICPTARLRLANQASGFSMTLGYHGEFGDHFIENAIEAELRKSF